MRTDFFNEAIVTAMLAASYGQGAGQGGPNGEDMSHADVLRETLAALMDRAGKLAAQAGMPGEQVEAADFAVCAFIDEVLLSSSSWGGHTDWLKRPLQFSRHGTATAGEDFYRLLDAFLEEAGEKGFSEFSALASQQKFGAQPQEEYRARDPLLAVLEIFALCLAQGFTGMFYGNPEAVQTRLDAIGRFVPAVGRRSEAVFFVPANETGARPPLRRVADLIRRFDPLDWALWLIPPALTALLYTIFEARLDKLLQPFLQGDPPL